MNTYTLFAAEVVKFLNREGFTELTDQVELLTAMGQRRINRECDLRAMEVVDSAFVIDSQTETVPSDLLRVKSISIDNCPVNGSSPQVVLSQKGTGQPTYYCIVGDNFYFGGNPAAAYTAVLMYYKGLDVPSTTTATNWVLENIPELLLFSVLMEASLYLKDDTRASVWGGRFEEVKQQLMLSEERQDKESGGLAVTVIQ